MAQPLRIVTRGSPLALARARLVADALQAQGRRAELIAITTSGDAIQDRPLAELGGKALWTRELDRAVLDGPAALAIVAMLERADPRDRLIGAETIEALPQGARVGTSSPRRTAQLLARRPDLHPLPIRGNVQPPLPTAARGALAATLLAAAGLDRRGIGAGVPLALLPAPAQGAIGVEILAERDDLRALIGAIDHRPTHAAVEAEGAFLAAVGGGCHPAVAALAEDGLLRAEILSTDGREVHSGQGERGGLGRTLLALARSAL